MDATHLAPDPHPAVPPTSFTYVELVWLKGRVERWIRFGAAADERILDRRVRLVGFAPGSIFGFVRWAANDRGTVVSRIDILAAPRPGQACSTVPGVTPGGEILLRLNGWPKVASALRMIDQIEAVGVDPAEAPADFWRHVHNRLAAGQTPRPYLQARHRAWLLRREVLS
jgi:hypothetical protein